MKKQVKPARKAGQGMNWISKKKRLAIYLRDGLACAYCGQAIEDGIQLTLDHLVPSSQGGTNHATNLITACHRCNRVRNTRGWAEFVQDAASYTDMNADDIVADIIEKTDRALDVPAAQALIDARGSFVLACRS